MKKFIIYIVSLALTCLFVLVTFTKAIEIGNTLSNVHEGLEILFYALLILVIYVLVIKPIFIILFSPYYSISNFIDDNQSNDYGIRKRAKTIIKNKVLNEDDEIILMNALKENDKNILKQRMNIVYNNQIKKKIDDLVISSAKDTMFLTAVSQSSFFDSMIVLINNFRLVKRIVVLCGFRPTFFRLTKLYINIILSSLIADNLQKIDISALISSSLKGSEKILTNSAINGIINAFFMLRVGMLTRNYIYAKDPKNDRITLKNNAFIEASKLIPSFISELVFGTVNNAVSSLSKIFIKDKENDEEEEEIKKIKYKFGKRKEK